MNGPGLKTLVMNGKIYAAQLKPTYSPCVVIKLLWSLCTPMAQATGSIGIYNMMLNLGQNLCTCVWVSIYIYIYGVIMHYVGYRLKFFRLGGVSILCVILIIQEITPRCFFNQQVLSDPIVKGQVFISEFHWVQQGRLTCLHPWLRKSSISGESMWLCIDNSYCCAKKTFHFRPRHGRVKGTLLMLLMQNNWISKKKVYVQRRN